MEFILGAATAVYVMGVAFFLWDLISPKPWRGTRWERAKREPVSTWLLIAVWPVAIVVAPLVRRIQRNRR